MKSLKFKTGLILCVGLVWATSIFASCLIFETATLLSEDFKGVYIDPAAKAKFIAAHDPENRVAAKFLADNVKIISKQEFETSLNIALSKVLGKIPEGESIALLVPDENQGHIWTSRYAQILAPRLRNAALVRRSQLKTFLKKEPVQHLIAIGDVAYSGVELADEILDFHTTIADRESSEPRPAFHFIRAAGTARSRARAKNTIESLPLNKISVTYGSDIPSISELVDSKEIEAIGRIVSDTGLSMTVPYFKMPDSISFPHELRSGQVKAGRSGLSFVPFIFFPKSRKSGPYRTAPFRSSKISQTDEFNEEDVP